jgi:hypothetical protein
MNRIFKCPNCKRVKEVEERARGIKSGGIVMILCGCGYCMDDIKEVENGEKRTN